MLNLSCLLGCFPSREVGPRKVYFELSCKHNWHGFVISVLFFCCFFLSGIK